MIDIDWFVFPSEIHEFPIAVKAKDTVSLPFTAVVPELIKEFEYRQAHTRCPAFLDVMTNTFLIRADFNLRMRFDPVNRSLDVIDNTEMTSELFINNKEKDNYLVGSPIGKRGPMIFSVKQQYLFLTEDDVEIQLMPCLYHESDFTRKTNLVVGKFNINKWVRPTEFAAIVRNTSHLNTEPVEITIKRGDPLAYIKFITTNNKPVRLNRITDLEKINSYVDMVDRCLAVKKILPGLSLKSMYKLFSPLRPKIKKCPFFFKDKDDTRK